MSGYEVMKADASELAREGGIYSAPATVSKAGLATVAGAPGLLITVQPQVLALLGVFSYH